MQLKLKTRTLDLSAPIVMGVLNVTPDSFSDGGDHSDERSAIARARRMRDEGAAIIDIGGESTRPGARPVPEQEELDRVIPVIEALRGECAISIDTMKPAVMRAACAAGAEMINDVTALRSPEAIDVARETGAAVCLMHMQGEPRTMQHNPRYQDVVLEVRDFLIGRAQVCAQAGIPRARIAIDPGFGFGKTLEHNLELLANLNQLVEAGYAVAVGLSRKSMFKALLGREVDDRLPASLAAATIAVLKGAAIVRAHDVAATVDAIRVAHEARARA
ncbi:MAG TPA: dihydropteroate synthase [Nevskiaceae bacterium]|nr:dihydropteroate synthase [Nevskiaceae bacterium]